MEIRIHNTVLMTTSTLISSSINDFMVAYHTLGLCLSLVLSSPSKRLTVARAFCPLQNVLQVVKINVKKTNNKERKSDRLTTKDASLAGFYEM
jgi:hypothetical protein